MAHFALVDETGKVANVVVIANEALLNEQGEEVEALGVAECERLLGLGLWIQTSYNGRIRNRHPGVGYVYLAEQDVFVLPQPYPSWLLNLQSEMDWSPPVPKPSDPNYWYEWDEENLTWVAHAAEDSSGMEE